MSNEDDNISIKRELKFKIIVIGDSTIGKSCLIKRAIRDEFYPKYNTTVGFYHLYYKTKIDDQDIKLQIGTQAVKKLTVH